MHDIDRTLTEFEGEMEDFMPDEFEFSDAETFGDGETGVFDEVEEMELASQFLEITDEAELDQFLGSLIKKAGRTIGRVVKSPIGRTLGGMLKGAAKTLLPVAGGALGSLVAPGVGTAIGSNIGQAAGSLFGLELEGLSAEDQEFEVARRFVRFAGQAAKNAAVAATNGDPHKAAKTAALTAAQRFAPGLIRKVNGSAAAIDRVFSEADEMDLAAELLTVSDEAELEQFLGSLFKKAGRALGKLVKSPVGQALGGIVRNAAQQALPVAGGALGSAIGGSQGEPLGSQLASLAGERMGLEFEGMDAEDQEFEGARRFVRFLGDATKKVSTIAPGFDPRAAAKSALTAAAKKHLPAFLSVLGETGSMATKAASLPSSMMMDSGQSGRWIRRGRKIVLLGV